MKTLNPSTSILCVTLLFSSSDTKSWNTKLQPNVSASVLYFCALTKSLWGTSEVRGFIIFISTNAQTHPTSGSQFYYLKSAFVTGYLSILKGCSWTSLVGDSPSLPSAALVPINIFPAGMFSVSSAAGCEQDTRRSHNLCWNMFTNKRNIM